jgi:uncharacterized membrane protein YfcA
MQVLDYVSAGLPEWAFWGAVGVTFGAAFVKGVSGFAMPLLMISTLVAFLPPTTALAALIMPTLMTNLAQALRQGPGAAWQTARKYRWLIAVMVLLLPISAQFVHVIPKPVLLGLLGVPVVVFAGVQLAGRSLALRLEHRGRAEVACGLVAGFYGGISGVWGPPVIVYLLSAGVEKTESVRVQGVVYLIGAVVLVGSHLKSGLLNAQTLPFSAAMMVPAMIGLGLGFLLQDRLDAARFRRWTLWLLLLSGFNLVRGALGGLWGG